jgi:serine O-acetyltransferase
MTAMDHDHLAELARRLAATPALHDGAIPLPDRQSVGNLCHRLLTVLFPGCFSPAEAEGAAAGRSDAVRHHLGRLEEQLVDLAGRAQAHVAQRAGRDSEAAYTAARDCVRTLLGELPAVAGLLATDVDAAFCNDPAAPDRATIVLSYPCIEALAVQRFAHRLYLRGVPVLPRMMTEWAHERTGIDIHPGAAIDESFFIDHGTGVVVGETSRIGKHCVLYQSVGLVAWNPLAKDEHGELRRGQSNKRHPDLEDHVTIYAGATILGGDTVIGHHSVIGGSVWLTHSVEPYTVVTIKDPELNIRSRKKP